MKQLHRALDVLELVAEHGEVRLADVVGVLGTPRATAYRLLCALEDRGYVDHARADHTYRVGVALQVLAARSTESLLVRAAAPALAALRAETGETVNLGVLSGGRIVYAAALEGVHVPRMAVRVGEVVAPHSTAILSAA
jgi:IclR family acetate operon transcriptional repressor